MATIAFEGTIPVSHEQLLAQIAHAKTLGYPEISVTEEVPPHDRRLAVVGGGPSIVGCLDEIKEFDEIWAINGACRFLRERGIESTLLSLDPCDFLAPRVAGATRAMLATRCHPDVFRALEGADITLFDAVNDSEGGFWASCSTVTVAFHLSAVLGYRKTVFFGCEGSFSEQSHAYMDEAELQDYRFVVECAGKRYLTAPDLYMLTQQMAHFFRYAVNESFTERSGGLLRALIACPEHDIVQVSRALLAGIKPILTLVQGMNRVEPDFRPAAVTLECDGERWRPEWQLAAEMPYAYEPGKARNWCCDGHRVYFDRPAAKDCRVTFS